MPRKLQKEALVAEKHAAEVMLSSAREAFDVVGTLQFERKLASVEAELVELACVRDQRASVALYFGGKKVLGARGIDADFAGEVLDNFQDLVSKRFASFELGAPGSRGPVAARATSHLMVTNVTHGSFGFLLEEQGGRAEAFGSRLSEVVDTVVDMLGTVASAPEEAFSELVADMDSRSIAATRRFFETLSRAEATMRLVEQDREVSLSRGDVESGRERTQALEIAQESGVVLEGELTGILPRGRRFEFALAPGGETISGRVAAGAARALQDEAADALLNRLGKRWRAEFEAREVRRPGQPVRRYYTLVALLEEMAGPAGVAGN